MILDGISRYGAHLKSYLCDFESAIFCNAQSLSSWDISRRRGLGRRTATEVSNEFLTLLYIGVTLGIIVSAMLFDLISCTTKIVTLLNIVLMVKQCSYCVLKVPNDDGPSMSIIEFSTSASESFSQYGTVAQFNQLPQTLFSLSRNPCYCHTVLQR